MAVLPSSRAPAADTLDANGNKVDDTPCWIAKVYSNSAAPSRWQGGLVSLAAVAVGVALQSML
jgi:hypothetical protein